MDTNIKTTLISAIVSLVIAMGTSIYNTRKNIKIEKEIYFRKEKIESLKEKIQKLEDIGDFYNEQIVKLTSFYYNDISLDDLIKYHDFISNQIYKNFVNFSEGVINIPFNNQEKDILDRLKLENLKINFNSEITKTNSKLKNIYASWDLNPEFKTENDNRLMSASEVMTKLIRYKFKTKIILNFLLELHLNEMSDIKTKKIDSEILMLKLNNELKKYNLKEL